MSHRLQRVAAAVLSGSLILLSPGLGCWSALAAAVTGSRAAAPAGGVPALGAIAAPAGLSSGGVAADLTLPAVGLESVPLAGEAPSARVEPALAAPAAPAPETAAIPESRTAPALAAAESAPRAAAPQELPVRAALQSIGEALAPSQGERAPANAYAASARAFDASALRASDGSADPVPADGGALGALRANELSPRTDSPAPGATAPEAPQASYGSSAAGHFLLASGLKKLELVLVGAGLFVLHGGALGITSTVALTAASVPLFALAGAFALTGLAYSLIGLRIAIAAWKQQKPAEEGAQAPPFWKRLGAALKTPLVTPAGDHPAAALLAPHALAALKAVEQGRGARGKLAAHLRRSLDSYKYLWEELKAFGRALKRGKALVKEMMFGDPAIEHHLDPVRRNIYVVAGFLVLDAILMASISFLLGPLVDTALLALREGLAAHVWALAGYSAALVGGLIAYAFVEYAHSYGSRMNGLVAVKGYRDSLAGNLLNQDMDFHGTKENEAGILLNRIKVDTNYLSWAYVNVRQSLAHYVLMAFFGAAALLYLSWPVALVVFLILPILGVLSAVYGDPLSDLALKMNDSKAEMTSRVGETFANIRTVQAAGAAEHEVAKADKANDELRELSEKSARLTANYGLLEQYGADLFMHGLFVAGAWMIALSMGITLGTITQLTIFAYYVRYAFSGLASQYLDFRKYRGASDKVKALLQLQQAAVDAADAKPLETPVREVAFEDVRFSYAADKPVLQGVSFAVKPGRKAAFVGGTGSGKSTILSLLLRLWQPQGGRILINGQDARTVTRDSLLAGVGVVPQSASLFRGTLRENILYGAGAVRPEDLDRALHLSMVDRLIADEKRFPKGLDTEIAEGGGDLSGGQKQKIALARALARNPSLLILDEATSALDYQSEREFLEAMRHLENAGDRALTTLVVAHRLSTVQDADTIFFLKDGVVAEQGTHAELLARGGLYAGLYAAQEKESKAGAAPAEPATSALGQLGFGAALWTAAGALIWSALAASALPVAAAFAVAVGSAFLAHAGLAYVLTGVRGGIAARRYLATIESAGPRGPTLWRALTHPLATPSSLDKPEGVFASLPEHSRAFLALHEAAHRDRGVGELRALIAQLPGARRLVTREFLAAVAAVKRWLAGLARIARELIFGDPEVRPILRRQRPLMFLAFGLLLANSLVGLALANLLGRSLDMGQAVASGQGSVVLLRWLTAGVLSLALIGPLIARHFSTTLGALNARFLRDVRTALQRALLGRELSFHLGTSSGSIATRVMDDTESVAKKNVEVRLPLVKYLIMIGASAALMVATNWWLAVAVFAVIPVVGILSGLFGKRIEHIYEEFGRRRDELGRYAREMFARIRIIKIFGAEKVEAGRFADRSKALVDVGRSDARARSMNHVLTSSLSDFFTKYLIYIAGAWLVALAFGMTIGEITAMTMYTKFLKDAFDGISSSWIEFKASDGVTKDVREWLNQPSAVGDAPDAVDLPADAPGAIEFRGAGLTYKDKDKEKTALTGVSLSIRPGERVAVVGETGSGKSTLLQLVQRYWDASEGQVLIDGVDVRKLRGASRTRQVAAVLQQPELFADTLRYNLAYGAEGATDDEIMEAVRAAGAEDFVSEKGLDFQVNERGENLSGGQQQRVAIVRALLRLKTARILILDEATSALDKATEARVQAALRRYRPTMLVVAHNLETIRDADRIVVMDAGRVVQVGTHEELLRDGRGRYWELWQASVKRAERESAH